MQHLQDVIGGPRECLRVDSLDDWTRKAMQIRASLGLPAQLTRSSVAVPAHVSDGRWVFDCPCGSAGLASHEWATGICIDCGTIHAVAFPAQRADVEAELLARPVRNRHFFPHAPDALKRGLPAGETLASIRRENLAYGIRRPTVEG